MKTEGYYKFVALATLFKRGVPFTKENIEIEIAYLKDRDRISN